MQTVDAAQVLRGNGNAKNGHDALGGEHARQVCCAARACDDGLNAALRGRFGILEHFVGHAVRAHNARFERDAEILEHTSGVLHDFPVGVAAHDDTNDGVICLHVVILSFFAFACGKGARGRAMRASGAHD